MSFVADFAGAEDGSALKANQAMTSGPAPGWGLGMGQPPALADFVTALRGFFGQKDRVGQG